MKKCISLVLVLMTLCVCLFPAAQAEGIQPRNSNYFDSYGTTLSKHGNGKIKIVFSAHATDVATQLGVANYMVQRLNSAGRWEDDSGQLSGSTRGGVSSYTFSRYYYGVPGETYRVQVTFICTLNGSSETQPHTSGRITAN